MVGGSADGQGGPGGHELDLGSSRQICRTKDLTQPYMGLSFISSSKDDLWIYRPVAGG